MSFRRSFGRAFDRPAIRGQGPILGAQTVGLFVDGIFIAGTLSSTPLDNIERIEVVKGPQSAMFGRATLAGAINYVTKKPGNEWEAKILATAADHDEFEARAFVSGPIIEDRLAFNIGVRHFEALKKNIRIHLELFSVRLESGLKWMFCITPSTRQGWGVLDTELLSVAAAQSR